MQNLLEKNVEAFNIKIVQHLLIVTLKISQIMKRRKAQSPQFTPKTEQISNYLLANMKSALKKIFFCPKLFKPWTDMPKTKWFWRLKAFFIIISLKTFVGYNNDSQSVVQF